MFNIAIDGPSAAGKTTISKLLSKQLKMKYLDTGSMYRTLAYACVKKDVDTTKESDVIHLFNEISIEFSLDGRIMLNQVFLNDEIRSDQISMLASNISKFKSVREKLVEMQREISKDGGYILDGRDVGSVILPNAEIKLYLDGNPEVRAKRRYDEYLSKGKDSDYNFVYTDMVQRDTQDMNREISPLKCVEDAYYIDTTTLSIEEVIHLIISYIKDKGFVIENKFQIAIDGPSATGKSTLAKLVAKHYGFTYIDTGAMYRSLAYFALKHQIDLDDEEELVKLFHDFNILFRGSKVFCNEIDITKKIRQEKVGLNAARIAQLPKVRKALVVYQQTIASQLNCVMDGRDVGTVVLPTAQVKFYIDATVEARAKRRYHELIAKEIDCDYDIIFEAIKDRDYEDTHREFSPLKKANDAIYIDSSLMTIEEELKYMYCMIDEKRKLVGE